MSIAVVREDTLFFIVDGTKVRTKRINGNTTNMVFFAAP
jgi:hypothetical protein